MENGSSSRLWSRNGVTAKKVMALEWLGSKALDGCIPETLAVHETALSRAVSMARVISPPLEEYHLNGRVLMKESLGPGTAWVLGIEQAGAHLSRV